MNTTVFVRIFAAAAALVVSLTVGAAHAGHEGDPPTYADRVLRGAWGFSASGVILVPNEHHPLQVVAVGVMEFDGAGGCAIRDTININGTAIPDRSSDSCSYQVNPDGTGTIEASFAGDPGPVPLSFAIVDKANSLRFIRTDLGVASGVAQRQRRSDH